MPLPRSLARLKREISEMKWSEAQRWVKGRIIAQKTGCQTRRVRTGWWWVFEEAGRPDSPAENRTLSDRAIPPLDKEEADS